MYLSVLLQVIVISCIVLMLFGFLRLHLILELFVCCGAWLKFVLGCLWVVFMLCVFVLVAMLIAFAFVIWMLHLIAFIVVVL